MGCVCIRRRVIADAIPVPTRCEQFHEDSGSDLASGSQHELSPGEDQQPFLVSGDDPSTAKSAGELARLNVVSEPFSKLEAGLGPAYPIGFVDGPYSEEDGLALEALDKAYGGDASHSHDPADYYGYSMVEATNSGVGDNTALYGELAPASLVGLLRHLQCKRGQRFYDIGSGTGKLVNLASLLGLRAAGVELEPGRHREACSARRKLQAAARHNAAVPALHDAATQSATWSSSFLDALPSFVCCTFQDVDFADADILFVNSVAFTPVMMTALAERACQLRPGAFVVSHKPFPGSRFKTVESVGLHVSWKCDGTCEYLVQEVNPIDT